MIDHLTRQQLKIRGTYCVSYLVRHINEDGSFVYQVNARTGVIANKYNMLRHAGTLFELCLWLKFFPDAGMQKALEKPFMFLQKHIRPWDSFTCVVEGNEVKLGGSALALLAFTAYYENNRDTALLPVMESLAGFLISWQKENGEFRSKYFYDSRSESSFCSNYYPGQAVLALTRFYRIQPQGRWLAAAKAGVTAFLSKTILITPASQSIEAWFSKAIYELLLMENNAIFESKLNQLVDYNIASLGKFERLSEKFTSASMASVGEALVAGLQLSVRQKKTDRMDEIMPAMSEAISFCLRLQIMGKSKKNSTGFIGGIKKTADNSNVRIDYVQHVLSVITALLSIPQNMDDQYENN